VVFTKQLVITKGGKVIGTAIEAETAGFSDKIRILVGVGVDGKIAGIRITQSAETPGLGMNAGAGNYFVDKQSLTTFYGQFAGLSAAAKHAVEKDGGEVVAITSATTTSRAVTAAADAAAKAAMEWLSENGGAK
jgi:electron transport complex protein RnfG